MYLGQRERERERELETKRERERESETEQLTEGAIEGEIKKNRGSQNLEPQGSRSPI